NEYIATEIERVPRKAIGARRDERGLWRKRDHAHLVDVEMECRPEAQEESEAQQKDSHPLRKRERDSQEAKKEIHPGADETQTQPNDDDADVVKGALEKNDKRGERAQGPSRCFCETGPLPELRDSALKRRPQLIPSSCRPCFHVFPSTSRRVPELGQFLLQQLAVSLQLVDQLRGLSLRLARLGL